VTVAVRDASSAIAIDVCDEGPTAACSTRHPVRPPATHCNRSRHRPPAGPRPGREQRRPAQPRPGRSADVHIAAARDRQRCWI